jgi:hypothetical protein
MVNNAGNQMMRLDNLCGGSNFDAMQMFKAGGIGFGVGLFAGSLGEIGGAIVRDSEVLGQTLPLKPITDFSVEGGLVGNVFGTLATN